MLGQAQPGGLADVGGVGVTEAFPPCHPPDEAGVAVDQVVPGLGVACSGRLDGTAEVEIRHRENPTPYVSDGGAGALYRATTERRRPSVSKHLRRVALVVGALGGLWLAAGAPVYFN